MAEYPAEIEADLLQYYPGTVDILDFHRGKISIRRMVAVVMQLPPGCRTWQATGGPLAWAPEQYFSAQIFHALNIANWQRSENGRKGKNSPEAPEPPKYTHEKKRSLAVADAKAKRFERRQQLNQRAITARAERERPPRPGD